LENRKPYNALDATDERIVAERFCEVKNERALAFGLWPSGFGFDSKRLNENQALRPKAKGLPPKISHLLSADT
jgi:hypothetical protein